MTFLSGARQLGFDSPRWLGQEVVRYPVGAIPQPSAPWDMVVEIQALLSCHCCPLLLPLVFGQLCQLLACVVGGRGEDLTISVGNILVYKMETSLSAFDFYIHLLKFM